jgi:hypothetical protein
MEYNCKLAAIPQLHVGPKGFMMPLCESCMVSDCSNPIEKKSISILGVSKKIKVYNRGTNCSFVVQCEGYIR